jgi:hypothetical protein
VNVEVWPAQIVFVPLMLGVGNAFTVKVRVDAALQPAALVAVAV